MYKTVMKNVYVIPGSPNTIVIKCSDYNWVVDPGMLASREVVLKESLSRLGVSEYDVLLSHTHYDHIEALSILNPRRVFVAAEEYSSMVNSEVRNALTYGFNQLPLLIGLKRIELQRNSVRIVSEEFKLGDFCGELVDLKGHSPGLLGLTIEDAIFVADSVFGDKLLARVGIPYHFNIELAVKALEKARKYAEDGYSGILSHGPFVNSKKLEEFIDLNLDRLRKIEEFTIEYLSLQSLSLEELVAKILETLGSQLSIENIILGTVTVNSILSKLSRDRGLTAELRDNVVKYRLERK
ncbi:MAG: hypothetical protein QXP68_02810 [Thermosphaera sp.]